jgi:hypothetical protein
MKSRYNFDNPGTSAILRTEKTDHRVNFKVGKSCGACKFFIGTSSTNKKGHCALGKLAEAKKKLREEKAHVMEDLSKNLQLRYQSNEKNLVIDGKTSSTREYLEIFENQVAFFNDSIKTIDNIIFGIKTRLDIEKTLGL